MPDLPPEKQNGAPSVQQNQEQLYAAQLSKNRAQERIAAANTEESEQNKNEASEIGGQQAEFPTKMFILALCFDALGLIPIIDIVCIVTEPTAGLIFLYWQKRYTPNTNPIRSLAINKIIDLLTLGVYPSNAVLVFKAYSRKKAANMV